MSEERARTIELELAAWREACRHLDIEDSLGRIEPIVASALPIAAIVVRRFDPARARLETVAVAGQLPSAPPALTELAPSEVASALALFEQPRFVPAQYDRAHPLLASLELGTAAASALLGAVRDERGPTGFVLIVATATFDAAAVARAAALLEPLGVALANDERLHELARLREAAEADNRALLTRLGRQSILETVVGERGGLRQVMERVAQVADTDVPVLILGETGSGKEVIARAIHERSRRRSGPMVRVNCGAIPTDLVDSELFGHEKGSFTGAIATRKGWFERADGGTLLLDEVGELPLAAQVRLLRILQEGTLERVGGGRTIHVDVRIVAATHRDLHQMVHDQQFREDLWYRLSVFPMRLPSLRERPDDIPKLAAHFAAKVGERLGGTPLVPSASDLELLRAYPWPGNVRELAAVIERAAILGHAKKLDVAAALGAGARPALASSPPPAPARAPTDAPAPLTESLVLDDVVRAHLERVLGRTHGRIEGPRGAAALLGINPHTLRARMRKLKLDWARFRGRDAD
ncbi:MAG: sigma-54 dependent transcriptional regulator [Sandaracinus sp.]